MNVYLRKRFSHKVFSSAKEAVKDIKSGSRLLFGGFGLCGIPENLIAALHQRSDLNNLEVVSNNCGVTDFGLGLLLQQKKIRRMIGSYVGENKELESQYLAGELELELIPQGTLAEKLRSGGAGIPAFYTPTGYGTIVHEGGFPIKLGKNGEALISSNKKETRVFNGKQYLLEQSLTGDFALIKGWKGDTKGNIVFKQTTRNFNYDIATAGKVTIAEVEHLVSPGELHPDEIHLPGIYVHRIIQGAHYEKRLEAFKRPQVGDSKKLKPEDIKRENIAKRAALELKNGMYVNLGIGVPTLVSNYIPAGVHIDLHAENGMLGYGPFPEPGKENPDLINAGKQPITEKEGCVYFKSSDSFAMVRGKHINVTILGALQVSQSGDLANWIVPGEKVKGMGGAMDLVASGSKVIITMDHVTKTKEKKILQQCTLPLTGKGVVSLLITDLAVFDFTRENGMTLIELFDGVSLDQVKSLTGCNFEVASDLKTIKF